MSKSKKGKNEHIFTLKRITHESVYKKYINGEFKNKEIKNISVKNLKDINICKEFSNNPEIGVFLKDPQKKFTKFYYSTNQKEFDYYILSQKNIEDKNCDYCRYKIVGEHTGMVVAYKQVVLNDKICHIFWIYGRHCSPECSLAEIREEKRKLSSYITLDLNNSECLTKLLYTFQTGKNGEDLKPRCYWRLLELNGGTVKKEETDFEFKQSGNIFLLPTKFFYEKNENV